MKKIFVRPLVLLGLSGSGKSTVAAIISEKCCAGVFEIGKYVVADAQACSCCSTALDHANNVFKSKDYTRFVRMAINDARKQRKELIFVGPRLLQEVEYICSFSTCPAIVGLKTKCRVREVRRLSRLAEIRVPSSLDYYKRRDEIEESWGANETLKLSQLLLDANRNPEVVAEQIVEFWKRSRIQ